MPPRSRPSDDVWETAQFIWENTPIISDRDLIAQLTASFGDDAPKSSGTISKRRKKYEWTKKKITLPSKKSAKQEAKQSGGSRNRKQSPPDKFLIPSEDNKAQKLESSPILEAKNREIEAITDSVVIDAKGRTKIIQKFRNRWERVGELHDQALDIALTVKDSVDAVSINSEDTEAGEAVKKAIILSESLSETVGNLAKSLKVISEVQMQLCGIMPDDFRQSTHELRMSAIAKFGDINEEERVRRDSKMPALLDRLREIEEIEASDDFGSDFGDDDNDDDDIDDVDYTAID